MRCYCTSPDNCTCDGVPIYRTLSATDARLEIRRRLNRREILEELEKLDNEEARILDLLARGLSREFSNPQRVGCPDSAVLRGIAFRELRLAEIQQWLGHLSSCSPCYQEFTELRKQAARSSKR